MSDYVYSVWAPYAQRVEIELVSSGRRLVLARRDDGHHVLEEGELTEPYFLRLDDGDRVTDPRALDVESVLGPCVPVDHARFAWNDGGFRARPLASGLVYELHVGTFTPEGTFDGASERLAYLADLGVTHVELMPVATFSGDRGWGYDGAALFAPHRAYGGVDGLKRFVDRAHAHGLGVILDVVYNHLGPVGNWLARFGPYFHGEHGTPWGGAVNFDGQGSDEVRRFFLDDARMWLRDYHIDGLRLDAVHAIRDASALPFLEELAREVRALGDEMDKPLVLIAESDLNDPRMVVSADAYGLGMDAAWSDDFHHALHVALTDEGHAYYEDFVPDPLGAIARALEHGWVLEGQRSRFRQRRHGRPYGALPFTRLLGYAQTHDQVGNRPDGARLSSLTSIERAKIAAAIVLTSPFVPMLFMGEEWAASAPFFYFTDHADPGLADGVRNGRRHELRSMGFANADPPDPQDASTFARSKLDWSELSSPPHDEMLSFVRALVRLRASDPAFTSGEPARVTVDRGARTLKIERGPFTICAALDGESTITLGSPSTLVLASTRAISLAGTTLTLAPGSVAITRTEGT